MMWPCGVCVYLCVCLCAGVRLHRVRPPLLAPRVGSSTRRKWQVASWRPLFPPIFCSTLWVGLGCARDCGVSRRHLRCAGLCFWGGLWGLSWPSHPPVLATSSILLRD